MKSPWLLSTVGCQVGNRRAGTGWLVGGKGRHANLRLLNSENLFDLRVESFSSLQLFWKLFLQLSVSYKHSLSFSPQSPHKIIIKVGHFIIINIYRNP